MGVIPCKDRFFLDKALMLVKPGIEELVAMNEGEDTYYRIVGDLYSGVKQLEMIFVEAENIPADKEQAVVIGKTLQIADKEYAGFVIIEFWQSSLHIYQAYIMPQYRGIDTLRQAYDNIINQAKLVGAPYLSLCTARNEGAKHFGFKETYTKYIKKL